MTTNPLAASIGRSGAVRRAIMSSSSAAPAILIAVSAAAALAYMFVFLRPLTDALDGVLPIDPATADPLTALLSAAGLGALTVGLVRGKSFAWWLAIATLAVALVAQARAMSHPAVLIILAGLLAVLLADHRRYVVETGLGWRRLIAGLLIVGGLIAALETSLIIVATGDWPKPLAALSDITWSIGNALGLSDSAGSRVLDQTSRDALIGLLIVASRLPFVLASVGVLSRVAEPPTDPTTRARARAIAEKYGCGALLPFQLGDDKLVFSPPDTDGIVVYGMAGRTAVILGDPIGCPESTAGLLEEFLARCRKSDWVPVIYQASTAGRSDIMAAGFRLFKVGEEAIVDLATFDTTGPRRANLRHTITRCRKDGVTFRWFAAGIPAEEAPLLDQLEAIDMTWRRTAGPEMGFTISHFHRGAMAWQPVCVALGANGKALGFTTFRQTGVDGGWVLDLMRRDPVGPPGVVETCIAEAAIQFRDAGARSLSLGLAPLTGLDRKSSSWEERLLANGGAMVARWYDTEGLARFKNKYDPYWIPRYGAIRRRRDLLGFVVALLRVHLAGAFHLPGRRSPRRTAAA